MKHQVDGSGALAQLARDLKAEALKIGFERVGVTDARPSAHMAFYRRWLDRGLHGEMGYLEGGDAVRRRADLTETHPGVRSVVVVADAYPDGDAPGVPTDPSRGVVARYARGADYHRVLGRKLERLRVWLTERLGLEDRPGRVYVDTGPVLERDLARRAGIGWFGRNTMLIDPTRGSYFLLGALLLELDLPPDGPFEADRCGTCHACLDACPTGALLGRDENGAPVIDARRCISYLTIEFRGSIPRALRPAIGNRVFGCDICQEVCPWNRRMPARGTPEPRYAARGPRALPPGVEPLAGEDVEHGDTGEVRADPLAGHPGTRAPSLIALLETSLDAGVWDTFSRASPIRRAGRAGFARNVCVALGNWRSPEAVPILSRALTDEEPLVREHAAWALGRIDSPDGRNALAERLTVETSHAVAAEIALALSWRGAPGAGARCPPCGEPRPIGCGAQAASYCRIAEPFLLRSELNDSVQRAPETAGSPFGGRPFHRRDRRSAVVLCARVGA